MSKVKKESALAIAFKFIWTNSRSLIFIEIALGIITAIIPLINIFIPAKIIGILSTTRDVSALVAYSLVAVLGNGTMLIMRNMLNQTEGKKSRFIYMQERSALAQKVFKIEYPNLEDAKFEGNFSKYKMQHSSPFGMLLWVINAISEGIAGLALSIAMISPFFGVVFKTTGTGFLHSPWYGAVLVGVLLVVAVEVLVVSSIINKKCYVIVKQFATYNRMYSFFSERLNDYNSGKDVRIYSQQDLIFDSAFSSIVNEGVGIYNKIHSLTAKQSGLVAVIGAVVGFGVYSIIGLKGLAGFLSIESVVLCVGGIMQVVSGISNISTVAGQMSQIAPLARDYNDIMEIAEERDCCAEYNSNFVKITASNISFKYQAELPLSLEGISFEINRGDKIALVGQNGSGKSTFIKLLCGLYPPTEGEFLLDDTSVVGYNSNGWRELFSVVFQDSTIFSQSLEHNIAGGENVDIDKLEKCLEQVGMLERVRKMTGGTSSYLYKHYEESGVEISGGEAQKLAMARALYKDAPIMILDEPTAALDPFAEQEIYIRFNELTMDKTVFYISHRLSSCYFCNKIVVFDEGKIVQIGTHAELLGDTTGKYHELWNAQAKYYV